MKTGIFNKFPQRHLEKNLLKKKVFLPTDPKKFGGVTGNTTFFVLHLSVEFIVFITLYQMTEV